MRGRLADRAQGGGNAWRGECNRRAHEPRGEGKRGKEGTPRNEKRGQRGRALAHSDEEGRREQRKAREIARRAGEHAEQAGLEERAAARTEERPKQESG